ncbi:2-dehydropantoate 2-reductase [Bacillus sp. B1-b2]|uniref:2-dehydropantoate 2-reductase n=1 Tax=Bacillus sp. B1-b2 TaxID=2653201 RepID=UPI001262398A|nr:2-dehydropantoate 2-reductase [Bacillus sp. B1-b2]KAB7669275.1 2-dehydropantoate 2-reductase [Bacillus sp. B1-b2]
MKIGIIGAGAIGLLCAYQLNKKHDVTLYVRSENQFKKITENGLCYTFKEETTCVQINVKYFSEWCGKEDCTIVAVKQYHLEGIFHKIKQFSNDMMSIMFVQNGMSHLSAIKELEFRNVLVGIVEHGALKENLHSVIHTGIGSTKMATIKGEEGSNIVRELIESDLSVFPFIHEPNYELFMQKKLFVNSIVNSLTSILKVKNGELLKNEQYKKLVSLLMEEIIQVLTLSKEEAIEYRHYCFQIIKNTANNKSSMLRDLEAHKTTEIDAILGYIIKRAESIHMNASISTSYYYMIKGMEQGEEGSGLNC